MIERVRRATTPRVELEGELAIDQDNLDDCLVRQPGLFNQVAGAVVDANASRDTLKLRLEEAAAAVDQRVREEAERDGRKITEAAISRLIEADPDAAQLRNRLLDARIEAERWQALKESFQQRSFMLRELVALQLAEMSNLSVERGARSGRAQLADMARGRAETARREDRERRAAGKQEQ